MGGTSGVTGRGEGEEEEKKEGREEEAKRTRVLFPLYPLNENHRPHVVVCSRPYSQVT